MDINNARVPYVLIHGIREICEHHSCSLYQTGITSLEIRFKNIANILVNIDKILNFVKYNDFKSLGEYIECLCGIVKGYAFGWTDDVELLSISHPHNSEYSPQLTQPVQNIEEADLASFTDLQLNINKRGLTI